MKKLLPIVLLILCTGSVNAAQLIKVVAMVNNDAVTSYQLEKQLTTAMAIDTANHQLSAEEHQALRQNILDSMIADLLVEQRIQELGLSVSDQEVDSAIEDVQRQNNLTPEQLKSALKAQGMPFDVYRKNLRKEILRYRLIGREVRSKIEVTNTQIRDYFKANEEDYKTPPTLRLGQISYKVAKDTDDQTRERLMQQVQINRQQLLAGKPFAEVLKSLDTNADGADMGTMIEAELNPQLHQGIAGLEIGQVSEPLEILGSIFICQVLDRTPAKAELSEEVRVEIEKILVEQNSKARFAEWKKELRKNAVIDIRI